jgi:hypothetical protein
MVAEVIWYELPGREEKLEKVLCPSVVPWKYHNIMTLKLGEMAALGDPGFISLDALALALGCKYGKRSCLCLNKHRRPQRTKTMGTSCSSTS